MVFGSVSLAMIGYLAGHHTLFPMVVWMDFWPTQMREGLVHAVMQTIQMCRPSVVYLMGVSSSTSEKGIKLHQLGWHTGLPSGTQTGLAGKFPFDGKTLKAKQTRRVLVSDFVAILIILSACQNLWPVSYGCLSRFLTKAPILGYFP